MKLATLPKRQKAKRKEIPKEEFLTTEELMRLLRIGHKQTIYKLIKEGLPALFVGRNYRFIKNDVLTFLKELSHKKRRKR